MYSLQELLTSAWNTILMLLWPRHARYRSLRPPQRQAKDDLRRDYRMDEYIREAKKLFESPLGISNLLSMSSRMQAQFTPKLQSSPICMLPSYIHTLPTGTEKGTYLALDVGGSTFRVAAVQLHGRKAADVQSRKPSMEILKMRSFRIDDLVKALRGHNFFDWMADRIAEVLKDDVVENAHKSSTVAMGLAWSFPIEQTSARSAKLLVMGKGFSASDGLIDEDLGELIMRSCRRKNLNVQLDAIINDGQATLMTRAYQDDAVCFGLILGTGTNMAIVLPTKVFAASKFGDRPQEWFDVAVNVLVNTELSMFGNGILPRTKWDEELNTAHNLPDFQPLEYIISGRYLGEIVRLVLAEAIQTVGLFDGQFPAKLAESYSLEASILAAFEDDDSPSMAKASAVFEAAHPMAKSPSAVDLQFIQRIVRLVSHRAAALTALGIHALWSLRLAAEELTPSTAGHVTVGCNGSIIEKYPRFRETCQQYLDDMMERTGGKSGTVTLEVAYESAIFGAAVAACCLEGLP